MSETKHSIWTRLFRGETAFDFVGRRNRWFAISGAIILVGIISLAVRGLNFGIEFRGGTVWEVQTNATVAHARDVIGQVNPSFRQATIEILTNRQSGQKTLRISAAANTTKNKDQVTQVSSKLAVMAGVDANQVALNDVGPTWGADITGKAERALVIFLIAVVIYITFRFEGKMAIAALIALLHDILITVGVYSISGFSVSPATVIAFLTILGYSLYDTVVVFDKIEENTKGLAASGRITYTETVNLSMNQVLMRSINTSLVAIMPILSILVIGAYFLGASSLQDFGLALFIGLLTGAYSSIFIAAPALAVMKEREPRYSQIRQRLANRTSMTGVLTPAAAASGELLGAANSGGGGGGRSKAAAKPTKAGLGSGGVVASSSRRSGLATRAPLKPGGLSNTAASRSDEVDPGESDQLDEAPAAPVSAGDKPSAPSSSAPDSGSASGSTAAAPRAAAAKPRPGPSNRPGGGATANRGAPRPRKKGRKR